MHARIKKLLKCLSLPCLLVMLTITAASQYITIRSSPTGPASEVREQSDNDILGWLTADQYKAHTATTKPNTLEVQALARPEEHIHQEDQTRDDVSKEHDSNVAALTKGEDTAVSLRQLEHTPQVFDLEQSNVVVEYGRGGRDTSLHNVMPTYPEGTATTQHTLQEVQALRTGAGMGIRPQENKEAHIAYPSITVLSKSDHKPVGSEAFIPTAVPLQQPSGLTGERRERARGYVLAETFWEQQTSGSRNLQSLQCWAGLLGLRVVEPFIVNSVPRTPLSSTSPKPRFGSVFDLHMWNRQSRELHHAELVPWEEFLQHAPRDVITVDIKYKAQEKYPNEEGTSKNLTRSERYKTGCKPGKHNEVAFLQQNKFRVIRTVCFNFEYEDKLTMKEFDQHIFASLSPHNATTVFRMWRGLGDVGRILVGDSPCNDTALQIHAPLSHEIIQMTETYKSRYLNGSEYIAVMGRLEKTKITMYEEGIVTKCLNRIVEYVYAVSARSGIRSAFLSIDIGKFGSNSFHSTGDRTKLKDEFAKFFNRLYGNAMTISQWSNTFIDVASTSDAGYIAALQKSIATQAKCIIFVGGGGFQKHALNLYRELHPQREQQCVEIIRECTLYDHLSL